MAARVVQMVSTLVHLLASTWVANKVLCVRLQQQFRRRLSERWALFGIRVSWPWSLRVKVAKHLGEVGEVSATAGSCICACVVWCVCR